MLQLGLLYMLVFLPMNMLSGGNTPLESMPPWLAKAMPDITIDALRRLCAVDSAIVAPD